MKWKSTHSSPCDVPCFFVFSKSSSYIVKQKGLGRIFSREPDNLAALHSYKHSGLVNDKAVGIQPSPSGKGVVVNTKKSNKKVGGNKVASKRNSTTISKGGSRRTSGAVAKIVGKNGYRSDLLKGEYRERKISNDNARRWA